MSTPEKTSRLAPFFRIVADARAKVAWRCCCCCSGTRRSLRGGRLRLQVPPSPPEGPRQAQPSRSAASGAATWPVVAEKKEREKRAGEFESPNLIMGTAISSLLDLLYTAHVCNPTFVVREGVVAPDVMRRSISGPLLVFVSVAVAALVSFSGRWVFESDIVAFAFALPVFVHWGIFVATSLPDGGTYKVREQELHLDAYTDRGATSQLTPLLSSPLFGTAG